LGTPSTIRNADTTVLCHTAVSVLGLLPSAALELSGFKDAESLENKVVKMLDVDEPHFAWELPGAEVSNRLARSIAPGVEVRFPPVTLPSVVSAWVRSSGARTSEPEGLHTHAQLDDSLVDALFRRWNPFVEGTIFGTIRNREDTEDLCQECWLTILSRLVPHQVYDDHSGRYTLALSESQLSRIVRTVAHGAARNARRAHAARQARLICIDDLNSRQLLRLGAAIGGADAALEREETIRWVRQGLQALPAESSARLVARYGHGIPAKKLARAEGRSESSMSDILKQDRASLRDRLRLACSD
jgi:RNA polymerase sigma factor (sigma-70 family)